MALRISLIAAMDRNNAIGWNNELLWRLPDDLKRFKALTLGKPVLMGRKTSQSLGRALPGRLNLVLTRSGQVPFEGMMAVATVEAGITQAQRLGAEELYVIGGGEIYAQLLPRADTLYLTHVETEVSVADAYFPRLDGQQWREVERIAHPVDEHHALSFDFVNYRRAR